VKKRTWSVVGKHLIVLVLGGVVVGQLICPTAQGNEQVLKSFSSADAAGEPAVGLIQDANGVLYGATRGGQTGGGAVFAINPDGSGFKVLHHFGSSANDAANPVGPLTLGVDGALYGISGGGAKGVGTIFTLRPDGSGYQVLHSFGTVAQDGTSPRAPLVQVPGGTFYGATYSGGGSNVGTVFAVSPDGTGYRLVHAFNGGSIDGANPQGGLILGKDGTLYGTTASGGTNARPLVSPGGTVFRLDPDGSNFSLLYSFKGNPTDGATPSGSLFQGSDGTLYGTSTGLGPSYNDGNVFRLNPNGSGYVVLHTFPSIWPTEFPIGGLVQGLDGSLYGATGQGQAKGRIFKIKPDGTGYAVVHTFGSFAGDGWGPNSPLLLGTDGAVYGTTFYGGVGNSQGTVFRVTTMPNPDPPFVMSIVQSGGGSFHIRLEGVVGTTYSLYSSTNLSDWTIQGTILNETGIVEFLDWNMTRFPQRFYRVLSMP
jgi:uncharacterized repeat protein (TIGR03803 family)